MATDAATISPPPPAGFTIDTGPATTAPAGNAPPPPAGFSVDNSSSVTPQVQNAAAPTDLLHQNTSIHAPTTDVMGTVQHIAQIPTDPLGEISGALDHLTSKIENYTQQGRAEHPVLSRIGDLTRQAKELLVGGTTTEGPQEGVLNSPVTQAMSAAPAAADLGASVEGRVTQALEGARAERATKATETASQQAEQVLKTRPKDYKNNLEPGRAVVQENVPAETIESANNARLSKDTVAERQHMESIRTHLDKSLTNLKEQQVTLLKHPTGEGFDIRPIIEDSYTKALEEAKKTGKPEIVKAINKTREEMLKVPNDDGELIADRYLNHSAEPTAEESNEVKRTFQGRGNYNAGGNVPDTPTVYANKLWKDVAAKVRLKLEEQVPGLGDVNSRIRNATAASKVAQRRIDTLRGMPALPSRMDRFAQAAKPALIKGAASAVGAGAAYDIYRRFLSGE